MGILGSYFGLETDYCDGCFVIFISPYGYLRASHDNLLPHPFQFIHQTFYCSMLYTMLYTLDLLGLMLNK